MPISPATARIAPKPEKPRTIPDRIEIATAMGNLGSAIVAARVALSGRKSVTEGALQGNFA